MPETLRHSRPATSRANRRPAAATGCCAASTWTNSMRMCPPREPSMVCPVRAASEKEPAEVQQDRGQHDDTPQRISSAVPDSGSTGARLHLDADTRVVAALRTVAVEAGQTPRRTAGTAAGSPGPHRPLLGGSVVPPRLCCTGAAGARYSAKANRSPAAPHVGQTGQPPAAALRATRPLRPVSFASLAEARFAAAFRQVSLNPASPTAYHWPVV